MTDGYENLKQEKESSKKSQRLRNLGYKNIPEKSEQEKEP